MNSLSTTDHATLAGVLRLCRVPSETAENIADSIRFDSKVHSSNSAVSELLKRLTVSIHTVSVFHKRGIPLSQRKFYAYNADHSSFTNCSLIIDTGNSGFTLMSSNLLQRIQEGSNLHKVEKLDGIYSRVKPLASDELLLQLWAHKGEWRAISDIITPIVAEVPPSQTSDDLNISLADVFINFISLEPV